MRARKSCRLFPSQVLQHQMQNHAVEQLILWLPTVGGTPVASSPLIAEQPELEADAVILPWMVSALPLPASESVELLSKCVDRQIIRTGVIVGRDLAFWCAVMRFAGAIVARQQYLPGVARAAEPIAPNGSLFLQAATPSV